MEDLSVLSSRIGIDLDGLRDKWSNASGTSTSSTASASLAHASANARGPSVDETLNQYLVCQTCQGTGICKTIYNHRTMEKNCSDCAGEGITKRVAVAPNKTSLESAENQVTD